MYCEENDSVAKDSERKSGRAAFDANGHTVWEWQTATGVFERYVSDEKLHELTSPNLALVEDFLPGTRKFEGLWIYDAQRPAAAPVPAPRRVEVKADVPSTSVMRLLRRLRGR